MLHSIRTPALLSLEEGRFVGGSQKWYDDEWQRRSGCGPTSAANLIWYLALSRPGGSGLCDAQQGDRQRFIALMERMFTFIIPGESGVNTSKIFTDGVFGYARSIGRGIDCRTLEIPSEIAARPDIAQLSAFLCDALDSDLPISFLNLCNGEVQNLEDWHWVTLLSLDSETMMGTITDQGNVFDIDLGLWLRTNKLGGAFIALSPVE